MQYPVLTLTLLLVVGGMASTQSTSSTNYFMPASERASGGHAASTTYRLEAALGAGVVPQLTTSTNFKLMGGFNACSDTPIAGQVWLSACLPLYGPITGGTGHTLHGHELNLGAATNITIGGQAATVASRTRDKVVLTLPLQSTPGWQPIVATNGGGTATLTRGIGILPMTDKFPPAIDNTRPFRVTYRGKQGDIFYMAVASAKFPVAVPLGAYNHGLELNLGALIGIIGPLPVTDPSGEFHFDIPGINFPRPLYVQMLGMSVTAPYSPGSFTNTISL